MSRLDDYERVEVTSADELQDWLSRHHGRDEGVWLVTYKKHVPEKHVPSSDVVDELLCYGWIDSVPRALDEKRSMVLIAPRRPGSAWSKVNKDKVAALWREGRIASPGLAKIEAAKKDGSWTFLDDVEAMAIPDDLAAALEAEDACLAFGALPPSRKKPLLEQIKRAKTAATREKRIAAAVGAALGL